MGMKNGLIQYGVALMRLFLRRHGGDGFLIVSTTGMGDTVWGTAAIKAVRQAHPEAYMGVLTSEIGKEVLENNPHLTEIFVLKKASLVSLVKLFFRLRQRKIGTVLVFHTSQRSVLPLCALLGARRIIGTENMSKGLDSLLTDRLQNQSMHEIERRLQIVQAAGADPTSKQLELFPSDRDEKKASELLPSGRAIGLHPGAKDRFKQWPASHFIALGKKLQEKFQCHIIVTGTLGEKELVEKVALAIPGARAVYEEVSILTLAALIDRLALYITNDTGPLHVACAIKTPTLALFTPTNPSLCGPYHAPHVRVIQKKQTCFPCLRKKCGDPFCLLQISPEEVFNAAVEML